MYDKLIEKHLDEIEDPIERIIFLIGAMIMKLFFDFIDFVGGLFCEVERG